MEKLCTLCKQLKSFEEFQKHPRGKFGLQPRCKTCKNSCAKIDYEKHRDDRLAVMREYFKENSLKIKETQALWRSKNLGLCSEMYAKRRAAKRNATPPWSDREAIRNVYKNRPEGCHVDHIIPLIGDNVCGLHVPYNLQYLPAVENMKKGNRYAHR